MLWCCFIKKGLSWRIGDGSVALFWKDHWSSCGILCDFSLDPSMGDDNMLVQDFWILNNWDTTLLYACLPHNIVQKIMRLPIGLYSTHTDK